MKDDSLTVFDRFIPLYILFLVSFFVGSAGAQSEIPIFLRSAQNPKILVLLDSSGSMINAGYHPDFDIKERPIEDFYASHPVPDVIYRVRSGNLPINDNHEVELVWAAWHEAIHRKVDGKESADCETHAPMASLLDNILDHPASDDKLETPFKFGEFRESAFIKALFNVKRAWRNDDCGYCEYFPDEGQPAGTLCPKNEWENHVGVHNLKHMTKEMYGEEAIEKDNLFVIGRAANGDRFIAFRYRRNTDKVSDAYTKASGAYLPVYDNDAKEYISLVTIPYRAFGRDLTIGNGDAPFHANRKDIVLADGLYLEQYLRWAMYFASDGQLNGFDSATRMEAVQNVLPNIVDGLSQFDWGLMTLGPHQNDGSIPQSPRTKDHFRRTGLNYSDVFYGDGAGGYLDYEDWIGESTLRLDVEKQNMNVFGATLANQDPSWGTPLIEAYSKALHYFDGEYSEVGRSSVPSPLTESCDAGHIILISDGLPSADYSVRDEYRDFRGLAFSDPTFGDPDDGDVNETTGDNAYNLIDYLDDFAMMANKTDYRPDLEGKQNVKTWIVSFVLDGPYLDGVARKGGSGAPMVVNNSAEFQQRLTETLSKVISSSATGGGTSMSENVGGDSSFFRPSFEKTSWNGTVQVYEVNKDKLTPTHDLGRILSERPLDTEARDIRYGVPTGDPNIWVTQDNKFIDANANLLQPLLYGHFISGAADSTAVAAPLRGDNFGIQATNDLIDFIHGYEVAGLRSRQLETENLEWRMGDIVYGTVVEVGHQNANEIDLDKYLEFTTSETMRQQPKILLTPANDGMLHAFDVATGKELWAYIPSNLLSSLEILSRPDYADNWRRSFVDGKVRVQDVWLNGGWKTLAIFGQRTGGATYTVLDITNRRDPDLLFEFSDPNLLGESWSKPGVFKMVADNITDHENPERYDWYLSVSTGNNRNLNGSSIGVVPLKDPKLLIVDLVEEATATEPIKATDVLWVNTDEDPSTDRGYVATDTGEVYRIMLSSDIIGSAVDLLFVDPDNRPITAQPAAALAVNPHYREGSVDGEKSTPYAALITFGTGRYEEFQDVLDYNNPAVPSDMIYGIFDPFRYEDDTIALLDKPVKKNELEEQTSAAVSVRYSEVGNKLTVPKNKSGYQIPLTRRPTTTTDGSFLQPVGMVTQPPEVVRGAVLYSTFVPSQSSCDSGGNSYLTVLDAATGGGLIIDNVGSDKTRLSSSYSSVVTDYNEDKFLDDKDIVHAVSHGQAEVVVDARVTLRGDEYVHDGVLEEADVLSLAPQGNSEGGVRTIAPLVVSLGKTGVPSKPFISTEQQFMLIQGAYIDTKIGEDASELSAPQREPFNLFRLTPKVSSFHEYTK